MKKLMIVLLSTLLFACSKPLPQDKLTYAGEWTSNQMYLLILSDGTVSYERLKSGGNVSIDAPLKEFKGEDFVVGIAFFTTTFDVSQPPYQENGTWYMVVDGIKLTKQ